MVLVEMQALSYWQFRCTMQEFLEAVLLLATFSLCTSNTCMQIFGLLVENEMQLLMYINDLEKLYSIVHIIDIHLLLILFVCFLKVV